MGRNATHVLVALVLAVMVLALAPGAALGTPYTWNGGTGAWENTANWTPTGSPTYQADSATVGSGLAILSAFQRTVNKLEVYAGAQVQIANLSETYLNFSANSGVDPTLVNNGIVRLADPGSTKVSGLFGGNPLTISGGGKLIMERHYAAVKGSILKGLITNSLGHTIEGVGTIDQTSLNNYGLVQATGDRLAIKSSTFTNYTGGILRSNPGAVLHFGYLTNTVASNTYQGAGGWLDINGGTISTDNATFTDAQIRNSGGSSGSLDINATRTLRFTGTNNLQSGVAVTVNGNLEVGADNGYGVYVAGHITGNSRVNVQDGGKLLLNLISVSPNAGATVTARDLTMSTGAAIEMKFLTSLTLSGSFSYAMQDGAGWTWNNSSSLTMTGTGPGHFLEVGGRPDTDPNTNNFLIPNLIINGDATLVDLFDNQTGYSGSEALYVENLSFTGSSLNLNNLELYYYTGGAYTLLEEGDFEGRVFNDPVVVPVPGSLLLLSSGLLGLGGWRFRKVFSTRRAA